MTYGRAMTDDPDVAPDGSPVPIYLALDAEPEFTPVLDFLVPPMTVLDLGCGVGRLANVLAQRGFEVTGVDESEAMLEHLDPRVNGVQASLEELDLGRRFDAVVLASHLINVAGQDLRRSFTRAAADHVTPAGVVLIEHWEVPDQRRPADAETQVGPVGLRFRVLQQRGDDFEGHVVYTLDGRSWEQTFWASLLDERRLDEELAAVGLRRQERLTAKWLAATA